MTRPLIIIKLFLTNFIGDVEITLDNSPALFTYRCQTEVDAFLLDHQNLKRVLKKDIHTELRLATISHLKIECIKDVNSSIEKNETELTGALKRYNQRLEEKINLLKGKLPRQMKSIEEPSENWQRKMFELYLKGRMQMIDPVLHSISDHSFIL